MPGVLRALFDEVSEGPIDEIDVDEPLATSGIDSLLIIRLNQPLAAYFEHVPASLFFEHATGLYGFGAGPKTVWNHRNYLE